MSIQWVLKHADGFVEYTFGAGVVTVSKLEESTILSAKAKKEYGEAMEKWSKEKGFKDVKWKPVDIELLSKRLMD